MVQFNEFNGSEFNLFDAMGLSSEPSQTKTTQAMTANDDDNYPCMKPRLPKDTQLAVPLAEVPENPHMQDVTVTTVRGEAEQIVGDFLHTACAILRDHLRDSTETIQVSLAGHDAACAQQ